LLAKGLNNKQNDRCPASPDGGVGHTVFAGMHMTLDARLRKVVIRRAAPPDIGAIEALARATPAAAQWPRNTYDDYLRANPPDETAHVKALFVASVIGLAKNSNYRSPEEAIAGFAAFSALIQPAAECELENMAVADTWRRRGIGSRLLAAGELWCRAQLVSRLWLEVRASNSAALALYEHAGFAAAGRRPGYYTRPDEDAVQMRKALSGHTAAC
jgi:[ribosomal protein S18]-alanine N-acetyltransferase